MNLLHIFAHRLCDVCTTSHGHQDPAHHTKISFISMVDVSKQKLHPLINESNKDTIEIQKIMPSFERNKDVIKQMAINARAAVGVEIVDLVNALLRRGNEIITAIDLVEETKISQFTKAENELRITADKLKKIDVFINMSLYSISDDFPGIVSANYFAEGAYKLLSSRQEQMKNYIELAQNTPKLEYFSDLAPILNGFNTLGQIKIDGVVKTPPSFMPASAKIFHVSTANLIPTQKPQSAPAMPNLTLQTAVRPPNQNIPQMTTVYSKMPITSTSIPMSRSSHSNGVLSPQFMPPSTSTISPQQMHAQQLQQQQQAQQLQHQLNNQRQQQINFAQHQHQQAASRAQQMVMQQQMRAMLPFQAPNVQSMPPRLMMYSNNRPPLNSIPQGPYPTIQQHQQMFQKSLAYNQFNSSSGNGHLQTNTSMSIDGLDTSNDMVSPRIIQKVVNSGGRPRIESIHNNPIQNLQQLQQQQNIPSDPINSNSRNGFSQQQNNNTFLSSKASEPPQNSIVINNNNDRLACPNIVPVSSQNNLLNNIESRKRIHSDSSNKTNNSNEEQSNTCKRPIVCSSNENLINLLNNNYEETTINRPNQTVPEKIINNSVSSTSVANNPSETANATTLLKDYVPLNKTPPKNISTEKASTNISIEKTPIPNVISNKLVIDNLHEIGEDIKPSPQKISEIMQNMEAEAGTSKENNNVDRNEDSWDDYCFVCKQGCDEETGDLACCDKCPHVFHNICHVPRIPIKVDKLPDDWICSLCVSCTSLNREKSLAFNKNEQLLCSKVILSCFKERNVETFYEDVSPSNKLYYATIKEPICLKTICRKVSNFTYQNIGEFIYDMNLLFMNCSTFNMPNSTIAKTGREIYALYRQAVRNFIPPYYDNVWIYLTLYKSKNDEDFTSSRSKNHIRRSMREKSLSQTPAC